MSAPKARTRRTLEARIAAQEDKLARLRASATKQARARDTRGQVLLAVALVKWAGDQKDGFSTLRSIARTRLSAGDFEAFQAWWRAKGYPTEGE
jgi:hypothetical protein